MKIGKYTIPEIRKAVVAVVLGIILIITSVSAIFAEWISKDVALAIASVIAFLTAVGVFFIKNADYIDKIGTGAHLENPPDVLPPTTPPPASPPTVTPAVPPVTPPPRIIPPES